jgi:hypothetical protein
MYISKNGGHHFHERVPNFLWRVLRCSDVCRLDWSQTWCLHHLGGTRVTLEDNKLCNAQRRSIQLSLYTNLAIIGCYIYFAKLKQIHTKLRHLCTVNSMNITWRYECHCCHKLKAIIAKSGEAHTVSTGVLVGWNFVFHYYTEYMHECTCSTIRN